MQPRFRSLLTLVALSVLPVGLIACGGGGSEKPDQVLKDTFSGGKRVKSGKLNVSLTFNGQGSSTLSGPVKLALTGPFSTPGAKQLPKFDFALAFSASGRSFSAGAVSTGDQGFIKLQGNSYTVTPEVFQSFKRGFEQGSQRPNGTANNPSLSSLGINPRDWLRNPSNRGDADIGGASTTHISSEVDLPKLLQGISTLLQRASSLGVAQTKRVPTTLTPQQQQAIQQVIKKASFDVYSGKGDKILRKLALNVGFTVPASASQRTAGLKAGNLVLSIEIDDLNKSQAISAPSNPKPFSELSSQLSGLGGLTGALGNLSGSGSGSSSSGGATGGTTVGNAGQQAYAQCILSARGDVTKAQACAKLLK
ncbi:MAG: hypothetical protein QOK04_2875 [Solirubrobacteraceae bacterium]|nr:hypothetical protein [Solirubrobacteraceae bacterium]